MKKRLVGLAVVASLTFAVVASADPRDREHVGSFFFRRHVAELRSVDIEADEAFEFPGLRLRWTSRPISSSCARCGAPWTTRATGASRLRARCAGSPRTPRRAR